jgi:ATPase subunit of ABC transporter with duplicated ATPase domains
MLQVNGVTVEVAGRVIVEDVTFSLRAGEVAGLVGRNGAGKTSLLKVLAGDAPAVAGRVVRTGALGYLPQDPRVRVTAPGRTGLDHVLSGRALDDAALRLEKLRLAL